MQHEDELYDVTIVGGGPAGLYAAFYSGMRDMKTKLIEAKNELGGKLLIYPEKIIWDVGGITPIRCDQLIEQLIEQAKTFDPTIVLKQQVAHVERMHDGTWLMTSHSGERHYTRTIILAGGYGVWQPTKLELEGTDRYEVTNLHYTVTSLERFRNKRVLLSGGSDTAVDWAMALENIASEVILVHRRERLGGHEKNVSYVMQSSIQVLHPYQIAQLHGKGNAIDAVTLAGVDNNGDHTDETLNIAVDDVIINHGSSGNHADLLNWGLDMELSSVYAYDQLTTNLSGIFVAGDMAYYPIS